MFVYSVTISIDKNIESDWKKWMLEKHIPDVMKTNFFSEYHMHKLLEPNPDPDSINYNIQYYIDSMEKLNDYRRNYSPKLQNEHQEKFDKKFVSFRSVLEKIS